ncbi:MAG: hypothetical protein MZV63_67585 [Marinilabiliales bacterium]|nr:hypothetical protein [Marinilabiliales bacterium]
MQIRIGRGGNLIPFEAGCFVSGRLRPTRRVTPSVLSVSLAVLIKYPGLKYIEERL